MSLYYFLEDHYIGGIYYQAGTTAKTADAGGTLPTNWVPTGKVDPQDTPAVTAFWNAGVQFPEVIRTRFQPNQVNRPVTFWALTTPIGQVLTTDTSLLELTSEGTVALALTTDTFNRISYTLTGLGVSLGPKILV